jgi:hypothetical protein
MMRRAMYGAVAFMALALVLFGAYRHVSAQGESNRGNPPASAPISHKAPISHNTIKASVATKENLVGTYFVQGFQNFTFFPGNEYTAVDSPLAVNCPGTSGTCTIVADMWVQTGGTPSSASNNYAVCLYVDTVNVGTVGDGSYGCHYTENTPSDGITFIEAGEENLLSGVALGAHQVQTFLYTNYGTPVEYYNISYRVYKP